MTEYTDKASQKSGKATPKGRSGKARAPKGKRAKTPGGQDKAPESALPESSAPQAGRTGADDKPTENKTGIAPGGDAKQPDPKAQAPDPATITFGSNRPIVAAPRKVPEGSGLRFSGPSAGELKASGPQPNSAKASGLTFTNAKSTGSNAKPTGGNAKPSAAPQSGAKPNGGTASGKPEDKKPDTAKAEAGAKTETKTDATSGKGSETSKVPASGAKSPAGKTPVKAGVNPGTKPGTKNAPLTKPAIAPQQSGRRLEKERSSSSFVLTLLGLVVAVGGLAFWLNGGKQTPAPRPMPQEEVAAVETAPQSIPGAAPEFSADTAPPASPSAQARSAQPLGPSPRAPETPGPLVGNKAPAATDLTAAEIVEIQKLLDNLGLGPGNLDGALTAETTAAIRAYQEMAGLPADGAANKALLEELRSVAELYGG